MREAHGGGLMGHFRVKKTLEILGEKTLEILGEHFCWPNMKSDVERVCSRCLTCKHAKSKVLPQG